MDNTSEEVQFTAAGNVENTTESFQTPAPPTIPLASMLVGLIAGVPGTCANAVVVAVLMYARRHFGSNVNTLIANQSAMDLLACVFFTLGNVMSFPGSPLSYPDLGQIGNNIVCFLFRQRVVAVTCMNAEKIGPESSVIADSLMRTFSSDRYKILAKIGVKK